MADKKLDQEIFAMFASKRMEAQISYLSRGRTLQAENTDKLRSSWVVQINAWANDQSDYDRQFMDDCEAELGLRGIDPPVDQAGDAIDKLVAKSKSATDGWDEEELHRAEERLQKELSKVRPSPSEKN